MPRRSTEGDDGLDIDSDDLDLEDVLGIPDRSDSEGDESGRDPGAGPGLTESERELADELNRRRELEIARDRYARSAGDGAVGSGGGGSGDIDAMAIIEASRRFGVDGEDAEKAEAEREAISMALAVHANRTPKKVTEYDFYAQVAKMTTVGNNLLVTLKVPWEHRDEVFRALDTMPFNAMVHMTEIEVRGG